LHLAIYENMRYNNSMIGSHDDQFPFKELPTMPSRTAPIEAFLREIAYSDSPSSALQSVACLEPIESPAIEQVPKPTVSVHAVRRMAQKVLSFFRPLSGQEPTMDFGIIDGIDNSAIEPEHDNPEDPPAFFIK
jgi:hypothetical protein